MDYQNTNEFVLSLVIQLAITAAYYMGPLLIYRFFIYKNKIPRDTVKKASIISGIVLYLILFAIYIAMEMEGSPNLVACVLWTSVASWIIRETNPGGNINGGMEEQIKGYVEFYRKLYGTRNPDTDKELLSAIQEVFIQIDPYLKLVPMDELQKEMKKSKKNVEEVSLNVMQNFAMMLAKENITGDEIISGVRIEAEAAIAVYRYINKIKLEKKYIDQFQYDENERLITAIRYNAPFI